MGRQWSEMPENSRGRVLPPSRLVHAADTLNEPAHLVALTPVLGFQTFVLLPVHPLKGPRLTLGLAPGFPDGLVAD